MIPGLFWGRIPKLQILFVLFWGHLDRKDSSLEPSLRALVQVRVAQINWCDFCIDYNALNLLERTNSRLFQVSLNTTIDGYNSKKIIRQLQF